MLHDVCPCFECNINTIKKREGSWRKSREEETGISEMKGLMLDLRLKFEAEEHA